MTQRINYNQLVIKPAQRHNTRQSNGLSASRAHQSKTSALNPDTRDTHVLVRVIIHVLRGYALVMYVTTPTGSCIMEMNVLGLRPWVLLLVW